MRKTWKPMMLVLLAGWGQSALPQSESALTGTTAVSAACGDTNIRFDLLGQSSEEIFTNREGSLGPRRLVTEQTSRIFSVFSRRLIQATASDIDSLELVVEKLSGSAGGGETAFAVCKTAADGTVSLLDQFSIPGGKQNQGLRMVKSYQGLKQQRLSIRLHGRSTLGQARFRLDLRRPGGEGQAWEPVRQAPAGPVTGFADLHNHQAADLAYAGGWVWGSHREGPLAERLPMCTGDNHATLKGLDFLPGASLIAPHPQAVHGPPDFRDWPAWNDIKHQQVSAQWLQQAHAHGLNLLVASLVNNQWMAGGMILAGTQHPGFSPADMEAVKRQLLSLQEMDVQTPWYTIVRDPWEARRAIARGELAVVLAVEVSDLMPESDGDWVQQLHDLYHMGVRSIQMAHETNSRFTGAAYHRDVFSFLSQLKARFEGNIRFASEGDGLHNAVGLSRSGRQLLDEMVRLNMLVDLAHLPLKTQRQIYRRVEARHAYYPLFNSHTRMEPLLRPAEKQTLKEFVTTPETLDYVRSTGGILGLRTGEDPMLSYDRPQHGKPVANDCDGSVRSWIQFYQYADDLGVNLAFGSDFNGFITQMVPRFGPDACFNAPAANRQAQIQAQIRDSAPVSPALKEFDVKGLAHVGLLPAVIEDMQRLGADTRNLENSAESFLKMWERAYDPGRKKVNSEQRTVNS
ncbi:MAG: membrane dipeptidase [Candidatus Sericytochromatia bacterium]